MPTATPRNLPLRLQTPAGKAAACALALMASLLLAACSLPEQTAQTTQGEQGAATTAVTAATAASPSAQSLYDLHEPFWLELAQPGHQSLGLSLGATNELDDAEQSDADGTTRAATKPSLGARASTASTASSASKKPAEPTASRPANLLQTGKASWYGDRFHGRLTASGERYNMHALTAAHPSLPFGTMVCVRGLVSGREVLVRINDRGPFTGKRIIDLSRSAAQQLGMLRTGLADVALWIPQKGGAGCGDGKAAIKNLPRR